LRCVSFFGFRVVPLIKVVFSPTTPPFPCISSLKTLTRPSALITRPSTTSASGLSSSQPLRMVTSTISSPSSCPASPLACDSLDSSTLISGSWLSILVCIFLLHPAQTLIVSFSSFPSSPLLHDRFCPPDRSWQPPIPCCHCR